MSEFYILPTTDIHLVHDPAITNGQQYTLNFKFSNSNAKIKPAFLSAIDEKPLRDLINININPTADLVNPKIIINTKQNTKTGFTFVRIRYDVGPPNSSGDPTGTQFQECIVRVWVHSGIEKIWINNNHLTIHSGSEFHGYVPSVFAKFTDTEIADITYHPYLEYIEENGGTQLIVNNHIVKAPTKVQSAKTTKLEIRVKGTNNIGDEVDVTIRPPFDKPRKILQKVHVGKESPNKINLLILGDGFTSYSDFKLYLDKTVDVLLNNRLLSPWNLLKENITIWTAFEPTINDKEGININYPVATNSLYMPNGVGNNIKPNNTTELSLAEFIKEVGLPNDNTPKTYADAVNYWPQINGTNLKEPVFSDWINFNTLDGYVENKDNILGSRMGYRLGDKISSSFTNSTKKPAEDWYYLSGDQRNLGFDRRRYPERYDYDPTNQHIQNNANASSYYINGSGLASPSPMDKYLGTLKYPNGSEEELNMGENWQTFGKDEGNIIILTNHYRNSGTFVSITYTIEVLANFVHQPGYSFVNLLSEAKLKITPTIEKKLEDNVSAKNSILDTDHVYLAGVLGHEFMHSIFIADEYEGLSESPDPSEIDIEPNISTINHLAKQGAGNLLNKIINPKKIKWNLKRVALSSMIMDQIILSGNILTVKLEKGETTKWQKVLDNDLPLYIRSSRYQPNSDIIFYEREINKITEINSTTDTLQLELKVSSDLGSPDITLLNRGCHIYLPKRLNDDFINNELNKELNIINPRLYEFIEKTEKPLTVKTDCNIKDNYPAYPPMDSDIITSTPNSLYPEFCGPNNRFMVAGVYEGGGLHNCKVYRPSGWSLMRLHGLKEGYVYRTLASGETLVRDVSPPPPTNNDFSIYSRLDFFAKYYMVARFYPTKLEDLDRLEYKDYDASIL